MNLLNFKYEIEYTLDQMRDCNLFDVRLMSTDWTKLIELMKPMYPEIIFIQRPRELALSDTPAQAYITHALEPYKEDAIYCLLQSTSPLRKMDLIYKTYNKFIQGNFMSLFTINKYTLKPDGQIYWFRDYKDIWRYPACAYPCEPSVDIDYISDLRIAESLLREDMKK